MDDDLPVYILERVVTNAFFSHVGLVFVAIDFCTKSSTSTTVLTEQSDISHLLSSAPRGVHKKHSKKISTPGGGVCSVYKYCIYVL